MYANTRGHATESITLQHVRTANMGVNLSIEQLSSAGVPQMDTETPHVFLRITSRQDCNYFMHDQ